MGIKSIIYYARNPEIRREEAKADLYREDMARSEARNLARLERAKQTKLTAIEKEKIRGMKKRKLLREGGIKGKLAKRLKQGRSRLKSSLGRTEGSRDVFGTGARDIFSPNRAPSTSEKRKRKRVIIEL